MKRVVVEIRGKGSRHQLVFKSDDANKALLEIAEEIAKGKPYLHTIRIEHYDWTKSETLYDEEAE
jgi:hypothetical protein